MVLVFRLGKFIWYKLSYRDFDLWELSIWWLRIQRFPLWRLDGTGRLPKPD
jgi:hypothetical protein